MKRLSGTPDTIDTTAKPIRTWREWAGRAIPFAIGLSALVTIGLANVVWHILTPALAIGLLAVYLLWFFLEEHWVDACTAQLYRSFPPRDSISPLNASVPAGTKCPAGIEDKSAAQ
jgi:hypothetical protein